MGTQGVHGGSVYVTNYQDLVNLLAGGAFPVIVTIANTSLPADTNILIPNPSGPHKRATISNSVVTLITATGGGALHADTTHVMWRTESTSVRFTLDGVNPIAGIPGTGFGVELKPNDSGIWRKEMYNAAKLIRDTTADAYIQIIQLMLP